MPISHTTISTDELIDQITKALQQKDGISLEDIANQILDNKVDYQGDSQYIQEI